MSSGRLRGGRRGKEGRCGKRESGDVDVECSCGDDVNSGRLEGKDRKKPNELSCTMRWPMQMLLCFGMSWKRAVDQSRVLAGRSACVVVPTSERDLPAAKHAAATTVVESPPPFIRPPPLIPSPATQLVEPPCRHRRKAVCTYLPFCINRPLPIAQGRPSTMDNSPT